MGSQIIIRRAEVHVRGTPGSAEQSYNSVCNSNVQLALTSRADKGKNDCPLFITVSQARNGPRNVEKIIQIISNNLEYDRLDKALQDVENNSDGRVLVESWKDLPEEWHGYPETELQCMAPSFIQNTADENPDSDADHTSPHTPHNNDADTSETMFIEEIKKEEKEVEVIMITKSPSSLKDLSRPSSPSNPKKPSDSHGTPKPEKEEEEELEPSTQDHLHEVEGNQEAPFIFDAQTGDITTDRRTSAAKERRRREKEQQQQPPDISSSDTDTNDVNHLKRSFETEVESENTKKPKPSVDENRPM